MTSIMTSSNVPLMEDIEGQYSDEDMESGIKNDFAYKNNVAGAAKQIRMGKNLKSVPCGHAAAAGNGVGGNDMLSTFRLTIKGMLGHQTG